MDSSKHKVVDSIKTRLQELIKSLDILYDKLDKEFSTLITNEDIEQINIIITEGLDDIHNGRPPFDQISDQSSNDDYSGETMDDESEQNANDNDGVVDDENIRDKKVQDIIRMVQSSINNMTR
ncbi:uncharacterized protein LOC124498215 [Dermatophagoides farinae]|uniref:Uncharacterized protein n=1 Tax=Dermatophagoides farinae TaxID=6954 RepID=A0A9D4SCC9_DERFA|nr:uncharacterized protein LOC124498215 [Dermatophagoides farinae]KAH7636458.1 hypothetical protein HUG17_10428 [Dermatophagoides farinae]